MTTNEGKKRRWYDFDKLLPWALLFQFCALVILVVLFAVGLFGEGAIPKQYYAAPWEEMP